MAEAIVEELREYCSDLLETGLAPAMAQPRVQASTGRQRGTTFAVVLRQVAAAAAAIPHLLGGLESVVSAQRYELVPRTTPLRASLPKNASAFEYVGGRMLPRWWDCAVPTQTVDLAPLGFVQFVLLRLSDDFARMRTRLVRHIEEARESRQGTSQWAQQDMEELDRLQGELDGAEMRLSRALQTVQLATAGRVPPTDRLPHPFPRSPEWASFRRLADAIRFPERGLQASIQDLLCEPIATADLPFLYQRWVGMRLVRELVESFGFRAVREPFGPLFLGGCVPLERDGVEIELWVEPRLGAGEHACGLGSLGAEATPDFVIITPGQGGKDAFVLDATLSVDGTVHARKSSYQDRVCFWKFRPVAGVPGRRRPLRAWAASPLMAGINQLSRPDGSAGCVPMVPGRVDVEGLVRAWLGDVVEHGVAWGGG